MLEEDDSIMSLAMFIGNSESPNISWTWYPAEDLANGRHSVSDLNKELFEMAKWPNVKISVKYLLRTRIIFIKFSIIDMSYLGKKMPEKLTANGEEYLK